MARGEWGYHNNNNSNNNNNNSFNNNGGRTKWWSYKRTTILVCSINILVTLYVLHSLFTSLYLPYSDSRNTFRYTPDQIRKMEESLRIRRASEPTQLINLVNQLRNEFMAEESPIQLPQQMKQMITDELLLRIRTLGANTNSTMQLEAVESWRKKKLRQAKGAIRKRISNSSLSIEDAGLLLKALGSDWPTFLEEIGFWIPVEVINTEHDDMPEGAEEEEKEILPGKQLPPECQTELHTDYGGDAVRWGLTHHKDSAYECCMACIDQAKRASSGGKKCNIWVYCPSEHGCYSPDIYEHKHGECWLKYSENPKVTFKDKYDTNYRNEHPNAPLVVPWVSGLISV